MCFSLLFDYDPVSGKSWVRNAIEFHTWKYLPWLSSIEFHVYLWLYALFHRMCNFISSLLGMLVSILYLIHEEICICMFIYILYFAWDLLMLGSTYDICPFGMGLFHWAGWALIGTIGCRWYNCIFLLLSNIPRSSCTSVFLSTTFLLVIWVVFSIVDSAAANIGR